LDGPMPCLLDAGQPFAGGRVRVDVGDEAGDAGVDPRAGDLEGRLRRWPGHPIPAQYLSADRYAQQLRDPRVFQSGGRVEGLAVAYPQLLSAGGGERVPQRLLVALDQVAPRSAWTHGAIAHDDAAALDGPDVPLG